MAQIISELFIQGLMDALGMGLDWKVFKGRFLQLFRSWKGVIDIWSADTVEELEQAKANMYEDINEIKGVYRGFEEEYYKKQKERGIDYLAISPVAATISLLTDELMNERSRQDMRSLVRWTGLDELGVTPDFVKEWSGSAPEKRLSGEFQQVDDEGNVTRTQVYSWDNTKPYKKPVVDAVNDLRTVFTEGIIKEASESFTRDDAEQMARNIVAGIDKAGKLEGLKSVGKQLKQYKETIASDLIEPAGLALNKISKMVLSKSPEDFSSQMRELSQISEKFAKLDPGDFPSQVDASVEQVLNDPQQINNLKTQLKKEDVSKEEIRLVVFAQARNAFVGNIIEYLDSLYEDARSFLMEGLTPEGLEALAKEKENSEYAKMILANIQSLDKAIQSLQSLQKKQGE